MDYTALIHGITELAAGASRQRILESRLDDARQLAGLGRTTEAVAAYDAVLKTFKNHSGAWHELALLHLKLGNVDNAAASLIESIRLEPWRTRAHHDLGRIGLGGDAAALAACAAALNQTPSVEGYLRLAHLQVARLHMPDAVETLHAAVNAGFEDSAVSNSLADIYELLGLTRESQISRGHARYLGHEYAEAVDRYSTAIGGGPVEALVYARLGTAYAALHRYPEALDAVRLGITHHANDQTLVCLLAKVLQEDGQLEASRRAAADATSRFPENLRLKQHALLSLPVVYQAAHEVRVERDAYAKGLDALTQHVLADRSPISPDRNHGLGTNFFLAYQGRDDRDFQIRFGAVQHHAACERDPEWSHPLPMPALKAGEKLRIGYVSANLYRHTVAKLFLGWLHARSSDRTEVYVYHLGTRIDPMTQQYQRAADHFRQLQGPPQTICRQITEDRLHVLVYLDVGMDDLTTQLAALYLAPVQCAAWGHPVTTGLPTIDYFISSELMEPPDADVHYSEDLVRLPGIGVHVPPPFLEPARKARADFGLSDNDVVYLSPQSVFKYLPGDDDLFCRIAARMTNAKFVFLEAASRHVTAQWKNRILAAFGRHGLDGNRFLVFLPALGHRDYLDLNCAADIFLDQPEWSGGMTSLEAIGCGLPVVTWPGAFMRGRHSFALLRTMGLDELVASDLDNFVDIAVRLGADPGWREALRRRTADRKHLVFNDSTCVPALEHFYFDCVSRRQGQSPR